MRPGGRYYFEIEIIQGQLLKIGVAKNRDNIDQVNYIPSTEKLQAFCDSADGWAIYNGELRHNSNSQGFQYGTILNPRDIVGVMVDMIEVRN